MRDHALERPRTWAERVFLFACEQNLDPPHRCPRCAQALPWGLAELQALARGGPLACRRCAFDLVADRSRRPLRYAMG